MRLPLLSQPLDRRGGSIQTNKRAAPPGVRERDVVGHNSWSEIDVGGTKSTTTTTTVISATGEQHEGGVSEGGQDQTGSIDIVSSKCTSTNSSVHEVFFLLGDEESVADVAERVTATCSAIVSPAVALNYNYTSGSGIEISSESWEVVQWYRESSFALALEGYNSTAPGSLTDTPITPALDSPFFTCLNNTIYNNLPVLPHPMILKSHSGWHPNGSSKGAEIVLICLFSIVFGPVIVPTALMMLAIVIMTIVIGILRCLEMCCTCCGLVSCPDVSGETSKPQAATPARTQSQMPPTERMTWSAEKGGSQAYDSSYAGDSLRFPPDAVIARSVNDWDTFRLLTGSHYHYDDSIMTPAYHTSQISRSSNNDNIQIMSPDLKRLSLSEAKSVLETRTSPIVTSPRATVLAEWDKNPIADSDSDAADSDSDSITSTKHLLVSHADDLV